MREIKIKAVTVFYLVTVFALAASAIAEDITVTSYYPSPHAAYEQLVTTGDTYLVTDPTGTGGRVLIGTTNPVATTPVGPLVALEGQIGNPNLLSIYGRDPIETTIAFDTPNMPGYCEIGLHGTDLLQMSYASPGVDSKISMGADGQVSMGVNYNAGAFLVVPPATTATNSLVIFDVPDPTSGVNIGVPPFPPMVAGTKLYVQGDMRITGTYHGTFNGVTADVAETYEPSADAGRAIEAGDVVVIDGRKDKQVTLTSQAYDPMVAGVVSTSPGLRLASEEAGVPLALVGRVPVKVTAEGGPIRRGDLLVTSSKPGYAMRGDPEKVHRGMVIGKSLGELSAADGVITALVDLN